MIRLTLQSLILSLVVGSLTIGLAASPAIGIATARGSFLADHARVSGNTTLFEGTLVETGRAASLLQLEDGVRMYLGSSSRGRVYRGRLVLEKGEGQLENASRYEVEARGLRVLPASSMATARVSLDEASRVEVAALTGAVRVTTADGDLVANLEVGNALNFEPQAAGAVAPYTVTGCLQKLDGRYLLKDATATVTFELKGTGLDKEVGHQVEVTGTDLIGAKPGPGTSEVIQVSRVKRLSGRCPVRPPVGAVPSAAGKAAGMSGTTKAIIAGVAIAAAGAGTTLGLIGEEEAKEPISR